MNSDIGVCVLTLFPGTQLTLILNRHYRYRKMFKFVLLIVLPAVLLGQPGSNLLNRAIQSLYNQIDVSDDNRVVLVEFDGYFLSFDRNQDEKLSHFEFYQALHHASAGFSGREGQLFGLFDQNDDANITRSDIEDSFSAADRNNDTHLTEFEFSQFIHSASVIVG